MSTGRRSAGSSGQSEARLLRDGRRVLRLALHPILRDRADWTDGGDAERHEVTPYGCVQAHAECDPGRHREREACTRSGTVDSGYTGLPVPLDAAAIRVVQEQIHVGTSVFDSENKNLGTIEDLDNSTGYMRVEKGVLFPKDIFLPVTSVAFLDDRGVHLSEAQGHDCEPLRQASRGRARILHVLIADCRKRLLGSCRGGDARYAMLAPMGGRPGAAVPDDPSSTRRALPLPALALLSTSCVLGPKPLLPSNVTAGTFCASPYRSILRLALVAGG